MRNYRSLFQETVAQRKMDIGDRKKNNASMGIRGKSVDCK